LEYIMFKGVETLISCFLLCLFAVLLCIGKQISIAAMLVLILVSVVVASVVINFLF